MQPSNELIKELAEFTLALVLFSDASRVGLHELRADAGLYLRLLGAGACAARCWCWCDDEVLGGLARAEREAEPVV